MHRTWFSIGLVLCAGCDLTPPGGTQIGALRVDPPPMPPSDLKDLDMAEAVDDAFAVAMSATLATAWTGHVASVQRGTFSCPNVYLGVPPEDLSDLDADDDATGLSWADDCATPNSDAFEGFAYWDAAVDPDASTGSRTLQMDARVTDGGGQILLAFDGEADDSLDGGVYTTDLVARDLSGSLLGQAGSLRGDLDATWGGAAPSFTGSIHADAGFGPADTRSDDPELAPELEDVTGWTPGMPRFTSARFELSFTEACPLEPEGYLGVRGNEGYWFDLYFLPLYDPEADPAQAAAYPLESIDNVDCDGIGTLFVRNLDLRDEDTADPGWSREIQVDFATILANLPTPTLDGYVYTLQDLPEDTP